MYAGDEEFVSACADFVRGGVAQEQPTLVMVGQRKLDLLREELNGDGDGVAFANMEEVGGNPARIIPAWREFADRYEGLEMRGIGEPIWASRSPAELVECQRHESLLNLAFAEADGFLLLCPYDTSALGDDVIEEARRSHPCLVHGGQEHPSHEWTGLGSVAEPFGLPLPDPATQPREMAFGPDDLPAVRDFVSAYATVLSGKASNIVMAANEAATNSVRYGGGEGVVRVWGENGALICEVQDCGQIDDPLVGRTRPEPVQVGGYGVWLMNQLCDLVQLRTDANGATVRLHVRA
jgi:anti-sigma regulatory factor (Ser/Thr protein kinase)